MIPEPVWLPREVVLQIHEEQIAEHGGLPGIRDEGLLDSALARPQHLLTYGAPTLVEMGAAYACGIARNHPFLDGNKRTAFLAMYTFLGRNGLWLNASEAEATVAMLELASGSLSEAGFAVWLQDHVSDRPA